MSAQTQRTLAYTNPVTLVALLVLILAAVAILALLLMLQLYRYCADECQTRPRHSNRVTSGPLAGHKDTPVVQTEVGMDPYGNTKECDQCGIALGETVCEVCLTPKAPTPAPDKKTLHKLTKKQLVDLAATQNLPSVKKKVTKEELLKLLGAATRPSAQTKTRRRVAKTCST